MADWYKPLRSLTSKGMITKNVGGLAGIADARKQHQGQFFTPDEVVRFVWALLQPTMEEALKSYNSQFAIFDNSFGSGRLFQYADPAIHTLVGIEADEALATRVQEVVSAAGFACALSTGSMTEFRPICAEYNVGIINPPFSLHFDGPEVYPFKFNSYGRYGDRSSAVSHKYALGQALACCQVVAAILPRSFVEELKKDEHFAFRLAGIYHLPKGAFASEGTDWPISVALFGYHSTDTSGRSARIVDGVRRLHPDCPEVDLESVGQSVCGPILNAVNPRYRGMNEKLEIPRYKSETRAPFTKLPVTGSKRVRVCHSGRKVFLGFDCAVAQVRVLNRVHLNDYEESRPHFNHDRVPVGLGSVGQGRLDLELYLRQPSPVHAWKSFLQDIRSWGYQVEADPGIENYLRRRTVRDAIRREPFRHIARMGADRGLMHWLGNHDKVRWMCTKECVLKNSTYGQTQYAVVGEVFEAERFGLNWSFNAPQNLSARRTYANEILLPQATMIEHFRPVEFQDREGWVVVREGLAVAHPEQFDSAMARALKLGLDKWCSWDFQFYDLIELSMKGQGIAAWEMGLGKARLLLALAMMGGQRNAIVVEAHLVEEMVAECKVLGISPETYRVFDSQRSVDKSMLRRINIFSYNRAKMDVLRRDGTKAAKGLTFAKRLRGMFNTVCCDEGHLLRNSTTDQSVAVQALRGKRRFVATGTPITNYCRDILPVIQWVAGSATAVQPYGRTPGPSRRNALSCSHFYLEPEMLGNVSAAMRGVDVFRTQFSVFEWVTNEFAEDMTEGAKREVPKIADVIRFRNFVAPFIKRRIMEEPDVARYVRVPRPERKVHTIAWELDHLIHYVQIAREFAEWYKRLSDWEKSKNLVLILAKIQAIIRACNFPQGGGLAGAYSKLTSKQAFALELAQKRVVEEGRKTMLAANSPALLDFMSEQFTKLKIPHVVFHGGVSVAKRNKALYKDFRDGPVNLLLCSNGCMQTGYNLPQVSALIAMDRAWTPKIENQRDARALRPQQRQTVLIDVLHLEGSIDEYQGQMCDMKAASMLAGLDYGADTEDDKDFVHMDHILGSFVEELEGKLGVKLDALIARKKAKGTL